MPGVSRSGATITAGLFLGLDRTAAARYSFLMATPITAMAVAYEGLKIIRGDAAAALFDAGAAVPGDEVFRADPFAHRAEQHTLQVGPQQRHLRAPPHRPRREGRTLRQLVQAGEGEEVLDEDAHPPPPTCDLRSDNCGGDGNGNGNGFPSPCELDPNEPSYFYERGLARRLTVAWLRQAFGGHLVPFDFGPRDTFVVPSCAPLRLSASEATGSITEAELTQVIDALIAEDQAKRLAAMDG